MSYLVFVRAIISITQTVSEPARGKKDKCVGIKTFRNAVYHDYHDHKSMLLLSLRNREREGE